MMFVILISGVDLITAFYPVNIINEPTKQLELRDEEYIYTVMCTSYAYAYETIFCNSSSSCPKTWAAIGIIYGLKSSICGLY